MYPIWGWGPDVPFHSSKSIFQGAARFGWILGKVRFKFAQTIYLKLVDFVDRIRTVGATNVQFLLAPTLEVA